jgi:O-antigen/teichoic acid export membrane protein
VDRLKGLRVGRNVLFLMAGQVVYSVINVAAMALLGNALAPQGYGEYAFYYALIPLFASASDAGIGIIVTREIARDPSLGPRLLGDALMIKAAVSGLILLVVLVIAWTMLAPAPALLIILVAATALIDPGQDPSIWIFRAREQLHLEALLLVLSQVVWLPLLLVGIATKTGLPALLAAATVAFVVRIAVGAVIVVRRFGRPEFRPERARLRRLLAAGLPFGAAMFGTVLYGRVGILALKALTTPADVAYLNVALMLSLPLTFVANALGIAILPMVSRDAQAGGQALRRDLVLNFKWQALSALPLTVGLYLLARPIVALLFKGPDFEPAAAGLQLLSLGLVVMFLNLSSRYVLAALDRQRQYLRAILTGLIVNVVLCAILIPSRGFLGACGAFLGAEVSIWIACHHALGGRVRLNELAGAATKPLLAALGMGLLVYGFRGANVVTLAALGCISYVGLLFLLRTFSEEEMEMFRNVGGSFGLRGAALLRRAENRP